MFVHDRQRASVNKGPYISYRYMETDPIGWGSGMLRLSMLKSLSLMLVTEAIKRH